MQEIFRACGWRGQRLNRRWWVRRAAQQGSGTSAAFFSSQHHGTGLAEHIFSWGKEWILEKRYLFRFRWFLFSTQKGALRHRQIIRTVSEDIPNLSLLSQLSLLVLLISPSGLFFTHFQNFGIVSKTSQKWDTSVPEMLMGRRQRNSFWIRSGDLILPLLSLLACSTC